MTKNDKNDKNDQKKTKKRKKKKKKKKKFFFKKKDCPKRISQKNLSKTIKKSITN